MVYSGGASPLLRSIGVAGCNDNRQSGPHAVYFCRKLAARHPRHRIIRDDDIDIRFGAQQLERARGRMPPRSLNARDLRSWQRSRQRPSHRHRRQAPEKNGSCRREAALLRVRLAPVASGRHRQPKLDCGAESRATVDPHRASRLGNKTVHHRQSETGATAGALGREERLGCPAERRLVHAETRVPYPIRTYSSGPSP